MIRIGSNRIGRALVKDINVNGIYLGPKLVWGREVELLKMFKSSVLADGGIYDEELFTTEFFRMYPIVKNEAIALVVCGAYKAGIIYGINCITGKAVPFTFGRTSVGTYIDKYGKLQTVGANIPRIDYDPVGLGLRGYLHENPATNLVENSLMDGNIVGWLLSLTDVTFNTGTTSRGRPMHTVYKTDTGSSRAISTNIAISVANSTYAFRVTLRADNSSRASIGVGTVADGVGAPPWGDNADTNFRIVSGPGTIVRVTGALANVSGLSLFQDTVVEVSRKYNNSGISIRAYIYPDFSSSIALGAGVKFSTPQMEINALGVCTSQMDASNGQVTRTADTLVSQSDLIRDEGSTLYFEGSKLGSNTNGVFFRGGALAGGFAYNASGVDIFAMFDGVNSVSQTHIGSNGKLVKTAGSFGGDGMKLKTSFFETVAKNPSYRGTFGNAGTSHQLMGLTGGWRVQNHLRSFAIIHRQLSDAEHIALTQP